MDVAFQQHYLGTGFCIKGQVKLTPQYIGDSTMDDEAKPLETPDAFLSALGESLKAKGDVDADLAAILTEHILKAVPALNAVAQAKDAIVKLAAERANPSKVEVANG